MGTQIDALELQITAQSQDATKGINALANSLKKLQGVTSNGLGLSSVLKDLEGLNNEAVGESISKLGKLSEAISKLTSIPKINNLNKIAQGISNIAAATGEVNGDGVQRLHDLADATEKLSRNNGVGQTRQQSQAADNSQDLINKTRATFSQIGSEVNAFSERVSRGALSGVFEKLSSMKDQVGSMFSGLSQKLSSAIPSGALSFLSSAFHGVGIAASSAASGVGFFVSGLFKIGKSGASIGLRLLGKHFDGIKGKIMGATKRLGGFLNAVKRIAMYRAIRAFLKFMADAVREGVQNLYQYSRLMGGEFAGSMDRIATSLQYVKNSVGAMVSPIINALAPAIDFLIDKFVALLNIINQLFARLTGATSFTRARKQAKSFGGAIGGAGKAAKKAAKEIRDATLGIDELNIISKPDQNEPSGGGGGGGGADFGGMFEEVPIDSAIADFADKLRAAFDAGDWKELGSLLGNKVNEIVDSIDWHGIGRKMGYWTNAAIQTYYWFLKTIDFTNIGRRFAELVNGALEMVDFTYIGRLLVRKITLVFDMLIGFITNLDWKLVGQRAGEYFIGMFSEASEWIESIDWGNLSRATYMAFINFVKGVDWSGVAKSLFRALGAAIGAAVSFVYQMIKDAVKAIADYFYNCTHNEDGTRKSGIELIKGLLKGIWEGIKNIGTWIYDNIFKPFVDGFKAAFGIHSPSTVMMELGTMIVEGLYQGIKNLIGSGIEIITGWATSIWNWFTGGDGEGNIFEKFASAGGKVVSYFKDKISNTYTTVKEKITTWATSVYDWFTGGDGEGSIFTKFKNAAVEIVKGFGEKVGSIYTSVKDKVTTWAQKVKEWYNGESGGVNKKTFGEYANDTVSGFRDTVASVYGTTRDKMATWAKKTKEWFTANGSGAVNNSTFSKYANNVISGFREKIGSTYATVRSNMTTWANSTKKWFSDIASRSAFSDFANNVISGFRSRISSDYTTVKAPMANFGRSTVTWFKNPDGGTDIISQFTSIGSNLIQGFINGVNSLWNSAMTRIKDFGRSIIAKGKEGTQEHSPSRAFHKIGAFVVEGFNLGVEDMIPSSMRVMDKWLGSVNDFTPALALAIDPSGLAGYDANEYASAVEASLSTHGTYTVDGVKDGMREFYSEYVEPTLNQIAVDVKRQAEKNEKTIVQIGNRTVKDAVVTQEEADGFRFVK